MSDAAVDQRLCRWCTKKKGGGLKCTQDIYERYHNMGMDSRNELIQVFKDALLNKAPWLNSNKLPVLALKCLVSQCFPIFTSRPNTTACRTSANGRSGSLWLKRRENSLKCKLGGTPSGKWKTPWRCQSYFGLIDVVHSIYMMSHTTCWYKKIHSKVPRTEIDSVVAYTLTRPKLRRLLVSMQVYL